MDALSGPTDAELVALVLTADREAFALVYDKYGTKLYDFAYSMLRHREDAADSVADSFVIFAERLPQLRDPDRLRPWLYAITRSECLRRLKARKRISYGDDEQLFAMPDDAITPEESAERAALAKIVWDAAAGLADRDRALLDLHLRQGLEGAELGEAMGVSAANAYVMLNRLRAQVDRSLGALLIARMGRDDCDDLDDLLADWDGTFSPLIRKRVARHVESCETCSERRKKIASPWMLLATIPVFLAPLSLRDRVVNDTQLVAFHVPGDAGGVPVAGSSGHGRKRAGLAAAAVLIAGSVLTTTVVWPDNDADPTSALPAATATAGVPSPVPTATTSGAPTPSVTASASAEPSATPIALAPGALALSTTTIDLGTTAITGKVGLSNAGDEPVAFEITSAPAWLTASPGSFSLGRGLATSLTVTADRSKVTEGATSGDVVIEWSGQTSTVKVSLVQENDPVVGRPSAADPTCAKPTVKAFVSVRDESVLTSVRLLWSGPNGSGQADMSRSGSQWSAAMGPFTTGGPIIFRVVATDSRGNTATSSSGSANATPCPG